MPAPKLNAKQPWLTVRNEGEIVEMTIAGVIGSSWYDDTGATSKEFREALALVPNGKKVLVRVNSEGGSVQDALEIYNLIRARAADVTTVCMGYALSSASFILCAGGTVITPQSSIVMIHEPWSMTQGDEEDHLRAAKMLAAHGDTIAGIYAKRTGKTAEEMRDLMRAESWYTGSEAVALGLADSVEGGGLPEDPADDDTYDARRWQNAKALLPFNKVPEKVFAMLGLRSGSRSHNTPHPKMERKEILAALTKAGITLPDNAPDSEILAAFSKLSLREQTTSTTNNAAPAAPVAPTVNAEVESLRAQLTAEKRTRIRAEVLRRGENKIANANLDWWTDLAMKDEANTFAQIEALAVAQPGGQPLPSGIVVIENRLEEINKFSGPRNASKRYAMLKEEWDVLIADALVRDSRAGGVQRLAAGPAGQRAGLYPVNANTYSATLVTQFLLDGCVTKLQNLWAPLRIFTKDYSMDKYKPRATAQLKYATAAGTTQKNATNFETSGDATISNVQIAVDQYTTAMHVTNDELNSGLRMENMIDVKTAEAADNILKVAFAPLATGSFTSNAAITRAAAAFGFSDMATAWGELKKSSIKYAVLDGEYMARIINSPSFFQATGTESGEVDGWKRFGWDGVFTNTNWTGTHSGAGDQYIRGLFCNPQVMGAVAGLPLTPPNIPGNSLQESTITIPDVGISLAAYSWFSLSSRTMWMSYDLMFGSSLLDESAGVLLTSQ